MHSWCRTGVLILSQKQNTPVEGQRGLVPSLPNSVDAFFIVDKVARDETVSKLYSYEHTDSTVMYTLNTTGT